MTVRSLSFATLLLAAPAMAQSIPEVQAVATPQEASNALSGVQARWTTTVENGVLVAQLTLVNTSSRAVDLVVKRGSAPGPWVQASVDGTNLEAVYSDNDMGEMMSRMGPRPTYAPIAAKKSLLVGTYRFALPVGYAGGAVRFDAAVEGPMGASVQLSSTAGMQAGS